MYEKLNLESSEKGWTCRVWQNTSSDGDMLDGLEWLKEHFNP